MSSFQPGADRFVIQYSNVSSAPGVTPPYAVTFQIVLYANGDVKLNYWDVPPLVATSFVAATPQATVGVQGARGLRYNEIACAAAATSLRVMPAAGQSILIRAGEVY